MSGADPTRQRVPVPTVPTTQSPVGTAQQVVNVHCSDLSDRSDHPHQNRGEKRKSLGGLVERLRQQQGGSSRFETRHELSTDYHTSNSHPSIEQQVGTVGPVGTTNGSKGLKAFP